ncbi:4306_t:CDS:2, partial [Dentiscutata heterogama]
DGSHVKDVTKTVPLIVERVLCEEYDSIIPPDNEMNGYRIGFRDFEKMIDPTIDKFIRLINKQLEQLLKLYNNRKCKAMSLV